MPLTPAALLAAARTPQGRKVVRYSVVSVISLCIGLVEEDNALAHAWLHFGDVTLDAPDEGRNFCRL